MEDQTPKPDQDKPNPEPRPASDQTHADPISGAPGSHPAGVALGAGAAGTAGAAIGSAAGPVAAVAGAVIGAVAGGLAGKGIAEAIDPAAESEYWQAHYQHRPYVQKGTGYEEYQPAYRYGWESRARYPDKSFTEAEPELARSWEKARGQSAMDWERARPACRDAWERISERAALPSADMQGQPAFDEVHWRETFASRSYASQGEDYAEYAPAYRFAWQRHERYQDRTMEDAEPELARDWELERGESTLSWPKVKLVIQDVWHHMDEQLARKVGAPELSGPTGPVRDAQSGH